MPLFIFPHPKDNIFCLFSPLKVIYFTVFRLNAQHKEKEYPEEEVHLWIDFFQDGQKLMRHPYFNILSGN